MSIFDQIKKKAADAVNSAISDKTEKVTVSAIPESVAALEAMPEFDRKDPYKVAALTVAVLCVYPADSAACLEMLDVLKGPAPLSNQDKQFIRDRFMDGKDYLPRSYFDGATPDNGYTPSEPAVVTVKENKYSRDNEGYLRLLLKSGGADSERFMTLRKKDSTGEWFLWEFAGILSGIRQPKSADPWA